MTVKARECATVILGHDDVARILGEGLCTTFSVLENLRVRHVKGESNGTFRLELAPKLGKMVAVKAAR